MKKELQHRFPEQFNILKDLFGDNINANRLNEIFQTCEEAWESNLKNFHNSEVKYLLIGEAPPWTEEGKDIRYFYKTFDGNWVRRVWYAFPPSQPPKNNIDECLKQLAKEHFLLIDSLPFAMDYTTKRNNRKYFDLVKSCSDYLLSKLQNPKINWSENVKVALAFKLNGKALIEAFPCGISLPTGQVLNLKNKIAIDGSNYTSSKKLRKIFGIK
ncbi:MAG: hypothetical protein ACOYU2_02335 [Nitrospirota bacterium]